MLLVSSCLCDVVIFDRIIQDFDIVGLFCQRKRERRGGGEICEIGKKVIKRMLGGEREGGRGRGRERDRSDRVAYSVVAGSRKEQQIQWLYRPSPV